LGTFLTTYSVSVVCASSWVSSSRLRPETSSYRKSEPTKLVRLSPAATRDQVESRHVEPAVVVLARSGVLVHHVGHAAHVGRPLEVHEVLLVAAVLDVLSHDVEHPLAGLAGLAGDDHADTGLAVIALVVGDDVGLVHDGLDVASGLYSWAGDASQAKREEKTVVLICGTWDTSWNSGSGCRAGSMPSWYQSVTPTGAGYPTAGEQRQ
jgi:hypothetical protein